MRYKTNVLDLDVALIKQSKIAPTGILRVEDYKLRIIADQAGVRFERQGEELAGSSQIVLSHSQMDAFDSKAVRSDYLHCFGNGFQRILR